MSSMLPLEKNYDGFYALLAKCGMKKDDFIVALHLDLDTNDRFASMWLALSKDIDRLVRFDEAGGEITVFDLDLVSAPYVDNFMTTNRMLALLHKQKAPIKGEDESDEDFKKRMHDYHTSPDVETVVIACATNSVKARLFAFLSVWERLKKGENVQPDDGIFEQFNAKCPKCGTVYPDQNRKICENCTNKKGLLVRLLAYFKDFKLQVATVIICMLLSSVITLVSPYINGKILYDQVIDKPTYNEQGKQITGLLHEEKYVYIVVGLIVALALVALFISIIQNRANAYMSTHVTKNMKNRVFDAMQRLSISFFNNNSTGRLINRVNYDAEKIRSFYIDGVPHLIVNLINFIGVTVLLFVLNWKLTLIVFIPVPIIVFIFKYMLPKLWLSFSHVYRRSSSLNSMLGDSLNGIRVVKAFAKEAEESARFYRYSTKLYEANLRTNMISLMIFPVVSLLIGMSSTAIWGVGGLEIMGDNMTYGELTTYIGYTALIFAPLNFFSTFTNIITDTINSAQRYFETIDMIPDILDDKEASVLDEIKGEVVFDKVCFHYTPNRPILKDVSFKIEAGQHVGLVGHTGSGKSTIANLITRMYDVISGSIYIDGHEIKKIDLNSLRRNIAIVSQDIHLFRGTIAENIKYARTDATKEEVIAAARAANAHDFIMRMPEGYETVVGIGARSLSGGERQRIAIARALLLSPSLLILDEATAAMDTQTEKFISEAIEKLIEGRTTITIAHRLATLRNSDILMAIEDGEIAEMGTEEELLEKKGIYYKLWTLQTEQMKQVAEGK
ncbi:MAG: ATP-binding cassette domain-containing protein [Clostridia bacterium]|nr:ATP-binding cassette domain-containing protein [Clostridia bacterium]